MGSSTADPFVVGRFIGDVVDMFVPTVDMSVRYGAKHITSGCDIKPSTAASAPTVLISGHASDSYTLVMTDPDAPSPSEPTLREWLHWIVTDIPGGSSVTQGNEVLSYMGPRPSAGIHRYIITLFKQVRSPLLREGDVIVMPRSTTSSRRAHFNTRAFAYQLGLGIPVAVVYFNAQREKIGTNNNNNNSVSKRPRYF